MEEHERKDDDETEEKLHEDTSAEKLIEGNSGKHEKKDKDTIKIKVPKIKFVGNTTDKLRKNPWIASTFVLLVLAIVLLFINPSGMTGNVVSANEAGIIVLDLAKSQVGDAEILEINSENGFYEVILLIEGEEASVYITKDGENLVSLTPLALLESETAQISEGYSEQDIEKISVFIDCLAEKGVKIYGANWCGWTKKFVVETLGGFDIAAPIYVECTESQELCSQEGVEGYPTIKINGELYSGPRTFEGLSEATGCPVPDVGTQPISTEEASCD